MKNHIFIVYTHHFWILWSDSPFRVYEETSIVVCVNFNNLIPSSRDIVTYALQKSVTWNKTIDGIQYRWKLQLQLYTMGQKKNPSIQAISSGLNYHQSVRFHHLLNIGKHRRGIAPKEQCKCTNSKYDRPVPRKKPKIGSETFTSVWVHGYLDVSLVINWKFNKIIGISRRVDCLLYISFTVTAVRLKKMVY